MLAAKLTLYRKDTGDLFSIFGVQVANFLVMATTRIGDVDERQELIHQHPAKNILDPRGLVRAPTVRTGSDCLFLISDYCAERVTTARLLLGVQTSTSTRAA
jgi:hypothetical protein